MIDVLNTDDSYTESMLPPGVTKVSIPLPKFAERGAAWCCRNDG